MNDCQIGPPQNSIMTSMSFFRWNGSSLVRVERDLRGYGDEASVAR
jgi:hypothetical protein